MGVRSSLSAVTVATTQSRTVASNHPMGHPISHPMRSAAISAVCLDIDGTLVDYGASMRAGLREMLGADDAWSDWCATTERHYCRFTAGEIDYDTMRKQRTKDFFAARGEFLDDVEVWTREELRMAAMCRAWQLFDDALPCLRRLRADGLLLAAVTNAASRHQRSKLRALGLDAVFDTVVISAEVGVAKPDPGIFHTACSTLGVRPERTVHVGDRLDLDAQGALAAGLHPVWLDRSQHVGRTGDGGITVISRLSELSGAVARIAGVPVQNQTGVSGACGGASASI